MKYLSDEFLEEYLVPFGSKRGCALLGKTKFDKLEIVKNFLEGQSFVIHDCKGKAQKETTISKIVAKYKSIPYVIFENCECILMNDSVLSVFAHLLDNDEYNGRYRFINTKGVTEEFTTSSFYVFLGRVNYIPKKSNLPTGGVKQNHIDSFCTYVNCYDFDTKKHYFG